MQNLGRQQRKEQIILPEMGQQGFWGIQNRNRLLKYDWSLWNRRKMEHGQKHDVFRWTWMVQTPVCGWGRPEVELRMEWGLTINSIPYGKACQGHFGRVSVPHQLYKQGHIRRIPFKAGRLESSGWGLSERILLLWISSTTNQRHCSSPVCQHP